MEVNKKQLADIFGASIRTIQNWQEQGMPVLRGGGKGNEVLYDSAAVIKWYAERDAEIENEKLRREVEELRLASEADLHPGTLEFERHRLAGVAYSRVSTFSGDYLRVTDNKGKTHDVLTGSDDGRHSNTSLAWGAGVQFNPTESVAIDIAYEGSGSGDWRTDGFIVGVGYKF
ncbi:Ail/Lom family outer membrane beta-barrel protein [Escherichia coli]